VLKRRVAGLLLLLLLAACGEPESGPVAAKRDTQCHLCGMVVVDQKGPQGQARAEERGRPIHFCSTSDLMAWLFQPGNRERVHEVWVHDMHDTPWEHPPNEAEAYIDARSAWYVVHHDRLGAMGHTLAPFATREAAEAFAQRHGGEVLHFDDLTVDLIAQMAPYAFRERQEATSR